MWPPRQPVAAGDDGACGGAEAHDGQHAGYLASGLRRRAGSCCDAFGQGVDGQRGADGDRGGQGQRGSFEEPVHGQRCHGAPAGSVAGGVAGAAAAGDYRGQGE